MEKHYAIGTFSKMTNITPRTLHYYDEIGLLRAKRTEAGHRFYTKDDLIILQKIVSLKFLGYSLETIQELLREETWDTVEYFTFQHKEMIKKRDQLNHSIRMLEHAQKIIDETGELVPDLFFLLINSVQMEEEHKKWLKMFVPENLVDDLYEKTKDQQQALEEEFILLITQIKRIDLSDPADEALQQCIAEIFTFMNNVFGDELVNFMENMEEVEISDKDDWLFPSFLFTPEEEEILGRATEIYLRNAGDIFGKNEQS